jgi:hypothetical protein
LPTSTTNDDQLIGARLPEGSNNIQVQATYHDVDDAFKMVYLQLRAIVENEDTSIAHGIAALLDLARRDQCTVTLKQTTRTPRTRSEAS